MQLFLGSWSNLNLYFKVLDIASLLLYLMILQKTLVMCSIASFTLLNSLMPMYILYIVFICSIVLFVEGHLVDWLI